MFRLLTIKIHYFFKAWDKEERGGKILSLVPPLSLWDLDQSLEPLGFSFLTVVVKLGNVHKAPRKSSLNVSEGIYYCYHLKALIRCTYSKHLMDGIQTHI